MLRSVFVAATAALLLAAGALSAAAGNRHAGHVAAARGQAITSLTSGATLQVKALDAEESAQAAAAQAAAAQAAAAKAAAAKAAAAQTPSSQEQVEAGDQSGPDVEADEQSGPDIDDQQDNTAEGDTSD